MGIPEMIGVVLAVTQFIKEFLSRIKITVQGTGAIVLSVLCSIGVVLYAKIGTPFTASWITDFIQVVIAANMGYKVFAGKGSIT